MGSQQSSLADSFDSANISFNGYNRRSRQKLYSITTGKTSSLLNIKTSQDFNDNFSTTSTNLSTVSLSTNICHSRFFHFYISK